MAVSGDLRVVATLSSYPTHPLRSSLLSSKVSLDIFPFDCFLSPFLISISSISFDFL